MYRRTSWPARTSCARSTSGGCKRKVRRPRGGREWRVRLEGASGRCEGKVRRKGARGRCEGKVRNKGARGRCEEGASERCEGKVRVAAPCRRASQRQLIRFASGTRRRKLIFEDHARLLQRGRWGGIPVTVMGVRSISNVFRRSYKHNETPTAP